MDLLRGLFLQKISKNYWLKKKICVSIKQLVEWERENQNLIDETRKTTHYQNYEEYFDKQVPVMLCRLIHNFSFISDIHA